MTGSEDNYRLRGPSPAEQFHTGSFMQVVPGALRGTNASCRKSRSAELIPPPAIIRFHVLEVVVFLYSSSTACFKSGDALKLERGIRLFKQTF